MAACEKCWREANHRVFLVGGTVTDHYQALLTERQCDEEEQKYGEHLCLVCQQPESKCSCEPAAGPESVEVEPSLSDLLAALRGGS